MLRLAKHVLAVACLLAPAAALAETIAMGVELNTAESADKRCRLTFVIANKGAAMQSFKLDLVVFDTENIVQRRLVTELAPVRTGRTVVRTYSVDGECARIGSLLVNDVTGCAPGTPDECIEGLTLTSRVKGIRLYK